MAGDGRAELEALKHLFDYLVRSVDIAALLPAAMSANLITDRQRTECANQSDPYKTTEAFLGCVQRAVNGNYHNFYTFVDILQSTHQQYIVSRLRDELAHSSKSLAVSITDEGEQQVVHVPDELILELADVRFGFAKLIFNYGREVRKSPIAQENFVEFLPRLCKGLKIEGSSFQSHFDTLIEEGISLFNVHYLKRFSQIFPEDVCTTTTQLVETYEQQLQKFKTGATLAQFKQLFPASATHSKLSNGKVPVKLKLQNDWDKGTIADLEKLVDIFCILGSHLHLTEVGYGCIEVTWLCTRSIVKDIKLKIATSEVSYLLQTMGVVNVLIGKEIFFQNKPGPEIIRGTTARLKYTPPKEEEVRKLSSSDRKDYTEGAVVGGVSGGLGGAGVGGAAGAGIGAVVGGIVGSVVPGPGTALGLAIGAAIGGGIGAAAGGVSGAGAGVGIGVGAVHHAKTKKREKNKK